MSKQDIEKASVEATMPQQALGTTSAPAAPSPSRLGNPGALGLFSFASTTLILSLYNIHTRGITHPNVVVGMAIFCGGLAQLLAGMWEFPRGNMLGGTAFVCYHSLSYSLLPFSAVKHQTCCGCGRVNSAFTSYGAFWMSYATILIPGSGIGAAYAESPKSELSSALGIYLVVWCLVTFFFTVVSLGKNIAFIALFGFLTVTFAALAGGEFNASLGATKAGGILGVITAFIAYYVGLSELLSAETHPVFRLPLGHLHVKRD
ncbi:putative GPR1/FUN34/yaaH family protein [Lyophyllum shimeji]|uniref:GPR1/FUN34/yaaH family protein n=1 Tax=Lyophyllum shimeji TaxID=47721 RepID=A0A9P3PTN7_LYOSH|nr:putative GPR1/FUN34/yaaH family protein [Lyophyllum shimeji]